MGGRKGYSLKKVVGDVRKIIKEKKELLEWIDEKNPQEVVKTTGKIIAKSDNILDSIAASIKFVDTIESEEKYLQKEPTKERRKNLSKKWAEFRKGQGKKFDPIIIRKVVDSVNRALEGKK
jgi:hypothetical protein